MRANLPITAEVVGGLGNQLFIYAAALEQATRLGVGLELDTSWFASQDKRQFELDQIFPVRTSKTNGLAKITNRIFSGLQLHANQSPVFSESSWEFNQDIFSIVPGARLRGYFQSLNYFPSVGRQVANGILNSELDDTEHEIVKRFTDREFNAIHVRRGDYLLDKSTMAFHGLTSRRYFEASLKLLPKLNSPLVVFTDSVEQTKAELEGIPDLWFPDELQSLSDIATLKLMSNASNLVMSNSSFSWWAAYVVSTMKPEATIICPRPWSRDIVFNHELIKSSWISLGM